MQKYLLVLLLLPLIILSGCVEERNYMVTKDLNLTDVNANIQDLNNVSDAVPDFNAVLKWVGGIWQPAVDGGGGTDTTLDDNPAANTSWLGKEHTFTTLQNIEDVGTSHYPETLLNIYGGWKYPFAPVQIKLSSSNADNTIKFFGFLGGNYDNDVDPVTLLVGASSPAGNLLMWGGGSATYGTKATQQNFFINPAYDSYTSYATFHIGYKTIDGTANTPTIVGQNSPLGNPRFGFAVGGGNLYASMGGSSSDLYVDLENDGATGEFWIGQETDSENHTKFFYDGSFAQGSSNDVKRWFDDDEDTARFWAAVGTPDYNIENFERTNLEGDLRLVDGNILMSSPDGSLWNCGVTDGGLFQCS